MSHPCHIDVIGSALVIGTNGDLVVREIVQITMDRGRGPGAPEPLRLTGERIFPDYIALEDGRRAKIVDAGQGRQRLVVW